MITERVDIAAKGGGVLMLASMRPRSDDHGKPLVAFELIAKVPLQ